MSPVITIDGPSGSGKGTLAGLLAKRLGWHCLDSGALYRLVGFQAGRKGIALDDSDGLSELAAHLKVEFNGETILLDGEDVSRDIRTEQVGNAASKVAALPAVREALLQWQRDFAKAPGLVADGRDMGSVVFPDAPLKIFLDASVEERANRRHKQLKEKGFDANLADLIAEIRERDERDRNRSVAPLKAPEGALVLESTSLSVAQVLDRVLDRVRETWPGIVV